MMDYPTFEIGVISLTQQAVELITVYIYVPKKTYNFQVHLLVKFKR